MMHRFTAKQDRAFLYSPPLHRGNLFKAFFAMTLCAISLMSFANSDKNALFRDAKQALAAANLANANLLAPKGYSKGSKSFQKAEVLFAKQRPLSKIQKERASDTK